MKKIHDSFAAMRSIVALVLVLIAVLWPRAAPAGEEAHDPIAQLTEIVGLAENDCNAAHSIRELADLFESGEVTSHQVEVEGLTPAQIPTIVACGFFDPEDPPVFAIEDGKLGQIGMMGISIKSHLAVMKFARGLRPRLERAAEGDNDLAWTEVRQVMIVGLLLYRHQGPLIYRLMGIAVIRVAAQEALRCDAPQVKAHHALFEQVAETCKRERVEAEALTRANRGRSTYLRLADPNPDKLVYDVITLLRMAEDYGGHPFGGELFFEAVMTAARADHRPAWDVLFASLHRFRDSENVATRRVVTEFFDRHDRAVIERALRDGVD